MSVTSKLIQVAETLVQFTPDKGPDPLLESKRVVGQRAERVDGPLKVSGGAKFAAEVKPAGLTYAALVCSTIARGKIAKIDVTAAKASPGVLLVMTHENAPKMATPPSFGSDPNGGAMSSLPVMQGPAVHWNGEPVAVVVAETQLQADRAASLVRVTYEADKPTVSFEATKAKGKPPKDVLGEPAEVKVGGDAEAALRGAAASVDLTFKTPRHYNTAIEPHACTAVWESDDALTLHDASQLIHATAYTLAKAFGLKKENVRVLSPFVGGGFGSKLVWNHQFLCVAAAKLAKRPVRLMLSREQVFRVTGGRTCTEQRVALGAKADGTLAALIHTGVTAVVSHNSCPEQFSFPARHLYAADSIYLLQNVVELDTVANTFMRAPGESIGTFALESALDELSYKLKLDPIELRKRIEPKKDPTKDHEFSSRHLIEAYQRGAERFGWAKRNLTPGATRDGPWRVGVGVATAYYPYYRMPGGSAKVRVTADGRAVVSAAMHEMGMGTATAQAQAAAERLGLPLDRVTFEYGDSKQPFFPVAGGSSQTVGAIAAVAAATEQLMAELLKLAGKDSPLAGSKPADLVARDGGLFRADGRGETYAAILTRAGKQFAEAEAAAPMPAEMMKYSMGSTGAQFAEVGVHDVTGEVRVRRWVGSFDCGRIVNPKLAASQFRGGIVFGIGLALTEELVSDDRTGRWANASLAEYHVPVHLDVPEIDVLWTDIPDPRSPMGARGIGEIGITGCGAAIANAVYHATGRRVRELPITLDKVMAATSDP